MTENIDIVKAKSLVQTERFVNVETMHSLKKVSEEIQQAMDVVDTYKRKVETLSPPVVNGEPWYKFPFGKASVTEVNKVIESFSEFVQETFKLVATSQNLQNENDMNICRLVGLLAIAEGNSYEKLNDIASEIKDLSTEDEESSKQLKELEKSFLQSLDDSALDSSKKEEQMARLIDYVTLFAESKTKKIRSISMTLSEVKDKLDKYSFNQDNWIEKTNSIITSWQEGISNSLKETCQQLEATIMDLSSKKNAQLDESFERLRNELVAKMAEQDRKLSHETDRQNIKINGFQTAIENKLAECKTTIEKQADTISSQNDSIGELNETVASLKSKAYLALGIGTISLVSIIGTLLFLLFK